MDEEIRTLVKRYGLCSVLGALARYVNNPGEQHYSPAELGVVFRRLEQLYCYLRERALAHSR